MALLATMSLNYKYDLADQVLIHAQRTDAFTCRTQMREKTHVPLGRGR